MKRGHEQVVFFNYPQVGLKAIVGIHNTVLGPALGGCRMRIYESEDQALDDVLRLSEGMTYKSSMAGLDLGGGKSCIMVDPHLEEGRRELFLKFGECLNHLNGRYITAEDMGTSVSDIMVMREVTKYAAGYSSEEGGSGDPSPWTARGVFNSIVAACERKYNSKDLKGRHISVQGTGHVGIHLVKMLKEAGATVTVCDNDKEALNNARNNYEVEVVEPEAIYDVDCDVYAPCAIGQTVNPDTIKRLKCDIIAGAANNQLSDESVYSMLEAKGILYCPDFVINAGGVISVAGEYNEGGWNEEWVTEKVKNIYHTIHRVLDESEKRGRFPEVVAVELAKERIREAEEKKKAG
ncbi:MAG: Glu/Leu/Phe/Val dehydrogenase [Candidatus Dadabacteria bacterium]|nr:MAG: Glu/Leu/Phe/Val dehydrogenase [Candidatus Dadabacteria bacterium]